VRSRPAGIVAGPGGHVWFTESSGNKIAFLDPTIALTPSKVTG